MSKSRTPKILRKATVAAVAVRQAYLLIATGLVVAIVGFVLAIIEGDLAQAFALAAGVLVVLCSLSGLVIVELRHQRQTVRDELARLDAAVALRKILAHG